MYITARMRYAILWRMKPTPRDLPFALNRNLRIPLATQLAENLRNAILSGYYKAGDILPSYKQLARDLGVSLRIPREAMADLVARNMVAPRPRIGCEVLPARTKAWKGRIHVIIPGDTFITYFAVILFEQFRKSMTEEGWLVDLLSFSRDEHGKSDFSMLDDALSRTCDFALLIYPTAATIRHLERKKIRYICFASDVSKRKSDPTISFRSAMDDVVRLIHRKKVRKVTLIEYRPFPEIHRCLTKAGIPFASFEVRPMTGVGYLERISRKGYELTRKFLLSRKRPGSDLVFFTDDFIARGGMCAILEAGLKVPEDLGVITFSNRGNMPFFPLKLTKIEADPFDLAHMIVDEILRRIAGLPPREITLPVQFVPGDSFRP